MPSAQTAGEIDARRLLSLAPRDFEREFRPTAMGWRGGMVLRRNAAVVLGNGLDRADVPALAAACACDPHPLVRGHAAWALGRIGSPSARAALRARAREESETSVLEEIAAALGFDRSDDD